MVRLALFMNANTKTFQMKYCPCPKYGMIYKPGMHNLQTVQKKHLKNGQDVKFTFQSMSLLTKKYKMVRNDLHNLQICIIRIISLSLLNNLKTRRKLKMYILAGIELSKNENTKKPQT